jgi:hypothetical protein
LEAALDAPVVETPQVLQKEAEFGDAIAQYKLGVDYLEGKSQPKDPQKALAWFRQAAAAGLPVAQYDLAVLLANGKDITHDDQEAARWFYAAAQSGIFEAQAALIEFYGTGRGVKKDPATALWWDVLARRTLGCAPGSRPVPPQLRGAPSNPRKSFRKLPRRHPPSHRRCRRRAVLMIRQRSQ